MPKGIYPRTKKHNKNISKAKAGCIPWNIGTTGKGIMKPNKTSFKKGVHPSPRTEFKKGHIITEKLRRKMSTERKGKMNTFYGKHHSKETKEKIKLFRSSQIFPLKDTSIERKVQQELSSRRIQFQKHKSFRLSDGSFHQVDIFIAPNVCIEADGDYWHNLENIKLRDMRINEQLRNDGQLVLRYWEYEINANTEAVVNEIEEIASRGENNALWKI